MATSVPAEGISCQSLNRIRLDGYKSWPLFIASFSAIDFIVGDMLGSAKGAASSMENKTDTTSRDDELASLAASQCHGGYGDESGNWRCKYQDRIKQLEAFIRKHLPEKVDEMLRDIK